MREHKTMHLQPVFFELTGELQQLLFNISHG